MAEISPGQQQILDRLEGIQAAMHAQDQAPAPPGPEVQRENPFAGFFRGAIPAVKDNLGRMAGGLIGLKDRLPSVSPQAGQRMAEQFTERASRTLAFGTPVIDFVKGTGKSLWESKTEFAAGALAGYITKEAAKTAASAFLPGGILVRAGVGALGGAAAAAAKEWYRQNKEYRQFAAKLHQELGSTFSTRDLAGKYDALQEQCRTESDGKKRELLSDQLRYMSVRLKSMSWTATREGKKRELTKKEVLEDFLRSLETKGGAERYDEGTKEEIRRKIEHASSIELGRIGKRAMRGAAFGAAGGILGGILVDWISSNLEAAPAPMPAAAPEPTATATVEPPKPSPTAVPAEATPAATSPAEAPSAGGPAIAPDVQAAGPPSAPEPPPAAPSAPAPEAPQPAAPTAPTGTESLPLTTAPTGAEVQGSTIDNTLTYGGKEWVIVDNGVKNIGNLFQAVGESGDIDKQALASSLQKATTLWAQGNLTPGSDPDLYKIFHLSNGTSSLYNNLLQNDTLESLKRLGIVIKK